MGPGADALAKLAPWIVLAVDVDRRALVPGDIIVTPRHVGQLYHDIRRLRPFVLLRQYPGTAGEVDRVVVAVSAPASTVVAIRDLAGLRQNIQSVPPRLHVDIAASGPCLAEQRLDQPAVDGGGHQQRRSVVGVSLS